MLCCWTGYRPSNKSRFFDNDPFTFYQKNSTFHICFYFIANFITICLVDYFMDSIYIPDALLFVISAFMAFTELAFDDRPKT